MARSVARKNPSAPPRDPNLPDSSLRGRIVAAYGRHYDVMLENGIVTTGYPRGKKSPHACGDEVELNADGQILGHGIRRSLLYRSDAYREKLIAANVTLLVLVVATEPSFSDLLLTRALVAAEQQGLRTLIVLNKCDLTTQIGAARELLAPLVSIGYPVIELSARADVSTLRARLAGELAILVGQSGMGKSTLINALVPDAAAITREVSTALDSGKHTTTHARLYALPDSQLIDSPGLQEFGLHHLDVDELGTGFIEFHPHLGSCRFRDCQHRSEPDCAIKAAVERGEIHPRRLAHFHQLVAESGKGH